MTTDVRSLGIHSEEDVPQGTFTTGRPQDMGKAPPPASNVTSASYKTQQMASATDAYAGMEISSAQDPKTGQTLAPHEINEASIVYVRGGPSLPYHLAKQLGFIKGSFNQGAPAAQDQQQQPEAEEQVEPEVHPDLVMEAFDNGGEADQLHDSYVESTSPGDQMRALSEIVDKGELSEATFITLASQMGLQRDEAEGKASKIMDAYAKQATAAINEVVPFVDPQAFASWAWENHPTKFAEVQKKHAMQRNTHGYKELAKSYLETMDEHSSDALLSANFGEGVTARREGKHVIIDIPGKGTFTWKSLVKAGFVGKPTRNS